MSSKQNKIAEKVSKLDAEVEWFYGEEFSLDQAAEKYRAATKLVQEIEADLEGLKNEIEIIDRDFTKE